MGGSGIWQMISLFLFRKSKAAPEKLEFMGMPEGKLILNLHNKFNEEQGVGPACGGFGSAKACSLFWPPPPTGGSKPTPGPSPRKPAGYFLPHPLYF